MVKEKILSFIIPAYNSEKFLRKCLNSFLIDSVLDYIEVIVVNDGSEDSTAQIGEEYHEHYPEVFSVVHKENGGHGSAINAGAKKAVGKYIKVIDSDDWVRTGILQEYVNCLANANADVIISPYYTVDLNSGREEYFPLTEEMDGIETDMGSMVKQWISVQNGFTFHGIAYRRKFYQKINHQLLEKVFYEDHEYATIPCCFANSILMVNLPLYAYQLGNASQSVDLANQVKRSAHLKSVLRRMEKYYLKNQEKLSLTGRQYFWLKLKTVINTYYKIVCLADTDKKKGRHLAACEDQILKKKLPEFWKSNHKKYVLFQMMNILHVSPERYSKMLNSELGRILKGSQRTKDNSSYNWRKFMETNQVKVS